MSRFARLALTCAATTYLLVVIGAIVRGTGSGMGCPDWPLCHGALLPPLGNNEAWIEWLHRGVAVVVGLLVLGLAVLALARERSRRSVVGASLAAVVLVGAQAWLGKIT
ncbi:MAG TPA: COX15/CtaA family protein, partial [Candidatus Limnocylindrales bacterium]